MEGKKHGRGKYVWSDGSYYDGIWNNNTIHGNVVFVLRHRVFIAGQMEEAMRAIGLKIKWRERVSTNGKMAENMRVNTKMIKNQFNHI